MKRRKEDFKSRMERQLASLHDRIVELQELNAHPIEHTPSYDTVHCEALQKHLETMERLRELDAHGDETWHEVGAEVKEMIAALRRAVEAKEATHA